MAWNLCADGLQTVLECAVLTMVLCTISEYDGLQTVLECAVLSMALCTGNEPLKSSKDIKYVTNCI